MRGAFGAGGNRREASRASLLDVREVRETPWEDAQGECDGLAERAGEDGNVDHSPQLGRTLFVSHPPAT